MRVVGSLAHPTSSAIKSPIIAEMCVHHLRAPRIPPVRRGQERLAFYAADHSLAAVRLLLVTGDGWTQDTDWIMTQWTEVSSGYARVYLTRPADAALRRLDQR